MKWSVEDAYRKLRKDPVLKKIIKATGKLDPVASKDLYTSLLTSIVSQQLSVKAADTIYSRFISLFPDKIPHPELILKLHDDQLRAVGLSYQKAGYLKNIASFSKEKTLSYKSLYRKSNDNLVEYLTEIKGVDRWTAEMILMFSLNRADVFPVDDLVIQNAIKKHYNLLSKGKELHKEMNEIAESWQPYRSLACRHLWKFKDEIVQ